MREVRWALCSITEHIGIPGDLAVVPIVELMVLMVLVEEMRGDIPLYLRLQGMTVPTHITNT